LTELYRFGTGTFIRFSAETLAESHGTHEDVARLEIADRARGDAEHVGEVDRAGEVWIGAEIKMAAEYAKGPKAAGTRGQLTTAGPGRGKKGKTGVPIIGPPVSDAPTLKERGLEKKRIARGLPLHAMAMPRNRRRPEHGGN
jgi:hypothetical protein